jgi:nucleoside-diphosphate-sugar epimerase
MRVFVTGVDGFIGARLAAVLTNRGHTVRGVGRKDTGDIGPQTEWAPLLKGSDAVIHLANRAHVTNEASSNPLQEFRRVNVLGTLRLAEIAQREAVRRFVFVSSIGVNGVQTAGVSFTEKDRPNPTEPYAISKLEAEEGLKSLAFQSKFELVIVRPPLVYGPNVKGNFRRLLRLVDKSVPLPLGSLRNLRSFVGVDNLAELLAVCAEHPTAAGELFLAADGHDVSTLELLDTIARAMRRRLRSFRFPLRGLRMMAALAGFEKELDRLTGSLQVDASRAATHLNWRAMKTFDAGIEEMVDSYLHEAR